MTDAEFKGLIRQLMQTNRKKTVDSLLAGNDTCCFTTEQYADRFVQLHWSKDVEAGKKCMRWPAGGDGDETLAHWHLSSYSRLVEIKPDLWTQRDLLDLLDLPELNEAERAAMNALPPDFIGRITRGERPLGKAGQK